MSMPKSRCRHAGAQITRDPYGRLTPLGGGAMSHATSSEMAIDESKKRKKEETPPNPMTRQAKNKKKEEDEREDGDNTRKELFPQTEADSTYKTYYKKENLRKKEPRWNQHLPTIEERTMQASTTHTQQRNKQQAQTQTKTSAKRSKPRSKKQSRPWQEYDEPGAATIHTGDARATVESTREGAKT